MTYKILYRQQALFDADKLKRNEPKAFEKLKKLEGLPEPPKEEDDAD